MPQQPHVENDQLDQANLTSDIKYSEETSERETTPVIARRLEKRYRRERHGGGAELRSIQWLVCILFLLVLIPVGIVIVVLLLDPDWLTQRVYP